MPESVTTEIAAALATHGVDTNAASAHSTWRQLVSVVQDRFANDPYAKATLAAAVAAPKEATRVGELSDTLMRLAESDRSFADQTGSLWLLARTELSTSHEALFGGHPTGPVVQSRELHLHAPTDSPLPLPHQIPVDIANFTGRETELRRLDSLVHGDGRPSTVVISAIAGAPGMGKTALAIRWAHRVSSRFPDGQLYVNLRGFGPVAPLAPDEVLTDFLRALDVAPAKIPSGVEAKAALYRSLLDGRRLLVLLDNAGSVEQIRPLLPGSPTCLVVVTSRSRLSGLVSQHGAHRISLDVLSPNEAVGLLRQIIGQERVGHEAAAAAELARQCGYLPLALSIAGERVAGYPHIRLADLVEELALEHGRLDALRTDDETAEVRAAFSWSYRALAEEDARTFRLLSLHAGPEMSTHAAAALIGISAAQARRRLKALFNVHLLEQPTRERWRFHDLIRCYSMEKTLAETGDLAQERSQMRAVRRVLSWYLHSANAANRALMPQRRYIPLDDLEPACEPLEFDHAAALEWCDVERANLAAATSQAAERELHSIAWQLPVLLWSFFSLRKHWADWINTHEIAISSARKIKDLHGEGWALNSFGNAYRELKRYDEAIECWQQALAIRREIGDRYGEGTSLNNLGSAYLGLARYDEAIERSQQALLIAREIGDRWNEGINLNSLGNAYSELRRYEQAIDCWQQALSIQREIGDRYGQGKSLNHLGEVYQRQEQWTDAISHYRQALQVRREIGDRYGEAATLTGLGHTLTNLHLLDAARDYWLMAEKIFEEVDNQKAAEVRILLRSLEEQG
jgi:tetratricopeptide (TPR) repeat protein